MNSGKSNKPTPAKPVVPNRNNERGRSQTGRINEGWAYDNQVTNTRPAPPNPRAGGGGKDKK